MKERIVVDMNKEFDEEIVYGKHSIRPNENIETETEETLEEAPKKKRKPVILGVVISLLVVLMLLGLLQCESCSSLLNDNITPGDQVTQINEQDAQAYVDMLVAEGMMNIDYTPTLKTDDGIHSTSFRVRNIANNHHSMEFTILDENGETIYVSPEITLNGELKNVTLQKQMSPGTHKCTIEFGYKDNGNIKSSFPLDVVVG